MIIQINGKVTYPITVDPSVWIFDDRKIRLDEAFTTKEKVQKKDPAEKAAEVFNQELYSLKSIKPPVNKSLRREGQKKALIHSYVMPLKDLMNNAEGKDDAVRAILPTNDDNVVLSIAELND